VTALRGDPAMAGVAARAGAGVVLMHMRGTPRTMQRAPRYADVVEEVRAFLAERAQAALRAGIARERLILDPGLGFGKTPSQTLALLGALERLCGLGYPVLVGPSRKSFIGKTLKAPLEDRLAGALARVAAAWARGAQMVRVHDGRETVQFLRMLEAIGASGR
jgi:dihydropteroate synthase